MAVQLRGMDEVVVMVPTLNTGTVGGVVSGVTVSEKVAEKVICKLNWFEYEDEDEEFHVRGMGK